LEDRGVNMPVHKLEKEIHYLEQQIYCCLDAREKRMLKRRLKKAEYMRLLLLGKLG